MKQFIYYIKIFIWNSITLFLNAFYYLRFIFYKLFTSKFKCDITNDVTKDGWDIVFDDEFDGIEVDFTRWNKWYSENTLYDPNKSGAENKLDCLEVSDGKLYMWTKVNDDTTSPYPCKTGMLDSNEKFIKKYGFFETRCKVPPHGKLFWPAFWLWASNAGWPPEIDIFEFMSEKEINRNYSKQITMSSHFGKEGKSGRPGFLGTQLGRSLKGIDWSRNFHTYSCRWEWNYIEWYIDNVAVYRTSYHVPTCNMRVVINNGYLANHEVMENYLPQALVVDYVRVYEKSYD